MQLFGADKVNRANYAGLGALATVVSPRTVCGNIHYLHYGGLLIITTLRSPCIWYHRELERHVRTNYHVYLSYIISIIYMDSSL
jgi:hypothetical protein